LVVQATNESGTEILIAGSPVTRGGDVVTLAVPHDARTTPARVIVATTRTSERTWAGTRIIVP
jgi:hypothetical protein